VPLVICILMTFWHIIFYNDYLKKFNEGTKEFISLDKEDIKNNSTIEDKNLIPLVNIKLYQELKDSLIDYKDSDKFTQEQIDLFKNNENNLNSIKKAFSFDNLEKQLQNKYIYYDKYIFLADMNNKPYTEISSIFNLTKMLNRYINYLYQINNLNNNDFSYVEPLCQYSINLSNKKISYSNYLSLVETLKVCKQSVLFAKNNNLSIKNINLEKEIDNSLNSLLTTDKFKESLLALKYIDVKYCLESTEWTFRNYLGACWIDIHRFMKLKNSTNEKEDILFAISNDYSIKYYKSYYPGSFYNIMSSLLNIVDYVSNISLGEEEFLKNKVK